MMMARGIASQSFAALWVNPGAFAGVKKMVAGKFIVRYFI